PCLRGRYYRPCAAWEKTRRCTAFRARARAVAAERLKICACSGMSPATNIVNRPITSVYLEYVITVDRKGGESMSGVHGGFTSTAAILVLYILLVIILSAGVFI